MHSTEYRKGQWDYIHLLSHLFNRRYLPLSYASDENVAEIIRKSPSKVVLPPLPDDARKVLVEHDKDVLMVFTSYALAYATQHASKLGPDCQLPLSAKSFSGDPKTADSPFRRHLKDIAVPVIVRSPFAANSGHGDDFASVKELARTARQGVHLNEHAIPSLEHIIEPEMPLDAALRTDSEKTPLQSKLNNLAELMAKIGTTARLLLFIGLMI
jgi:hypothetical protein